MWTVSRYNCAQASSCGLCQGITILRLVHVDSVKGKLCSGECLWTVSRYNCAQASACGLCQGITGLVLVDCVKV